jgi:hypothetical protein
VAFAYAGTSLYGMDCNVAWSLISVHRLLWLPVTVLTRVVAAIPRRNTASGPCLTVVPSPGARRLRSGRRSAQARYTDAPGGGVSPCGRFKEEMPPGLRAVFEVAFAIPGLLSRRWLGPWMLSPVRCNRLPVTVTGHLSVGRKQGLRCRVRAGGHFPRERQILTAAHRRRRTPSTGCRRFRIFPREPHHPVWNHRPRHRLG